MWGTYFSFLLRIFCHGPQWLDRTFCLVVQFSLLNQPGISVRLRLPDWNTDKPYCLHLLCFHFGQCSSKERRNSIRKNARPQTHHGWCSEGSGFADITLGGHYHMTRLDATPQKGTRDDHRGWTAAGTDWLWHNCCTRNLDQEEPVSKAARWFLLQALANWVSHYRRRGWRKVRGENRRRKRRSYRMPELRVTKENESH